MTTRWGAASQGLVGGQAEWHTACDLLKAGQYEQAAELLGKVQVASELAGDASLAQILAAAHRICQACSQVQAEGEWYQQAHQEADRREQDLRQQLQAILNSVSEREVIGLGDGELAASAPMAESSLSARDIPGSPERTSLWQRVQRLLGRGSEPRLTKSESPVLSAKGTTPVSATRTETPVAVPIEQQQQEATPSLVVYCLGPFRAYQDDKLITDWPSGKGKAIFKYMLANRDRPIPKDVLMDLFWRDADPGAARNNLNVAIYGLRQAFRAARPDFSHILFQDDRYLLNQDMDVWTDVEEFMQRYEAGQSHERRGKLAEAIREYEVAEGLYQGDFLEEDLYEDWPMVRREGLKDSYLFTLDRLSRCYLEQKRYATCIHLCQKILAKDDCREDAHRRLMRGYSRQGQRNLALRQYHLCAETLAQELDVPPIQETKALYFRIRNGETV